MLDFDEQARMTEIRNDPIIKRCRSRRPYPDEAGIVQRMVEIGIKHQSFRKRVFEAILKQTLPAPTRFYGQFLSTNLSPSDQIILFQLYNTRGIVYGSVDNLRNEFSDGILVNDPKVAALTQTIGVPIYTSVMFSTSWLFQITPRIGRLLFKPSTFPLEDSRLLSLHDNIESRELSKLFRDVDSIDCPNLYPLVQYITINQLMRNEERRLTR